MTEMKSKSQAAYTISSDECHLEENGKPKLLQEKAPNEYDPHNYGNTKHPIDYWGAVVHLVRSTIGTGILLLPHAFQGVGYGVGIVGSIVIGLLYVNNVHALLFSEYELCKKLKLRNLNFVEVVEKSFENGPKMMRKFGPYFKTLLYLYYGVPSGCAVYLIVIADNSKYTFEHFFGQNDLLTKNTSIIAVTVLITLLCLIPKLKFLVPLSILTNVFTVINIGIILAYPFSWDNWKRNAHLVGEFNRFPNFFALFLQSLIATGMILPLKNDMRKPKSFASPLGVLNVSFFALTALFGTFGLVGCLNYGKNVDENILSNLPKGELVTVWVYILYTLALCVTYTLLFYVYYDTIWSNFLQKHFVEGQREKAGRYALRLSINLVAFLMAIAVPEFRLFSLIVGTIGIIVEMGLPSTLQLLVLWTLKVKPSIFRYCLMKNLTIILIAIIVFCFNFQKCISEVIDLYTVKK